VEQRIRVSYSSDLITKIIY